MTATTSTSGKGFFHLGLDGGRGRRQPAAASRDAMDLPLLGKVHGGSTSMQGQRHGRLELFRSSTSSSNLTLRFSPMEGHRRRPSDGGGRLMVLVTAWRLLLCDMVKDEHQSSSLLWFSLLLFQVERGTSKYRKNAQHRLALKCSSAGC